jgi:hypothetical protein
VRSRYLSAVVVALVASASPLLAQDPPNTVAVEIATRGSVPPIAGWYACANSLRGKTFDREASDRCLRSILERGPVTGGDLTVEVTPEVTKVLFSLRSPELILKEVDFGLPDDLAPAFLEFSLTDPDVLRTGTIYNPRKEDETSIALDLFLKSKGMFAVLSRKLELDYAGRTGSLHYTVSGAHLGMEEAPLPPFGRKCEVYVKNVNAIDIDDMAPLPLVEDILGIRKSRCFSEATRNAETQILNTALFSSAAVRISGTGEWRDVSLSLRTNPTMVRRISYKWYGELLDAHTQATPTVALLENQTYRRSLAQKSLEVLKNTYGAGGLKVKVIEEDRLEMDRSLTVVFHVAAGKRDTLFIDGKKAE